VIKLDYTENGVLVVCGECPQWDDFGFDREEAWRRARKHELAVHPGRNQALSALAKIYKADEEWLAAA
jgi:hypothetical protein